MATKKKTEKKSTWKDLDRKARERLLKQAERRAKETATDAKTARRQADAYERTGEKQWSALDRRHATSLEKASMSYEALADLIRRNLGK